MINLTLISSESRTELVFHDKGYAYNNAIISEEYKLFIFPFGYKDLIKINETVIDLRVKTMEFNILLYSSDIYK